MGSRRLRPTDPQTAFRIACCIWDAQRRATAMRTRTACLRTAGSRHRRLAIGAFPSSFAASSGSETPGEAGGSTTPAAGTSSCRSEKSLDKDTASSSKTQARFDASSPSGGVTATDGGRDDGSSQLKGDQEKGGDASTPAQARASVRSLDS